MKNVSIRSVLSLLTASALLLAGGACNGDDDTTGTREEVRLQVEVEAISFDTDTLRAPAGAEVVLEVTNRDKIGHNMAFYRSEDAEEELFVGEIFTGPDETRIYRFTAPDEPGQYYFQCDPHFIQMNGTFIVEEPGS